MYVWFNVDMVITWKNESHGLTTDMELHGEIVVYGYGLWMVCI